MPRSKKNSVVSRNRKVLLNALTKCIRGQCRKWDSIHQEFKSPHAAFAFSLVAQAIEDMEHYDPKLRDFCWQHNLANRRDGNVTRINGVRQKKAKINPKLVVWDNFNDADTAHVWLHSPNGESLMEKLGINSEWVFEKLNMILEIAPAPVPKQVKEAYHA
jgi:hypothetical protein